jgi:hypothetical protein
VVQGANFGVVALFGRDGNGIGGSMSQKARHSVWCSTPEKLANANFITPQVWTPQDEKGTEALKRKLDYEQSAWLKKGITPLRWMGYPHEKSERELVAYWASVANQGYVGIAIDEIGHISPEVDAKAARALVTLKRTHPNLFVAVWHAGGLTDELLKGYRDGADLILLETYGVPFEMQRYKRWIEERISTVRKAGIIHKTVIAIGINDAASQKEWQKVGQWVNSELTLRQLLTFIRQIAPDMPGIAFFAPRASQKMLTIADKLAGEIFGKPAPLHDIIADYNAELRRPDGRVDVDLMVARLKELGVNTYFWLIWHAPTDWDDLQIFLPKAAEAGIQVCVYLVPPSESPPYTKLYSEPFRLDYIRWAEEIAKLSLKHPNLTAWVIDDFYANRQFFTPDYVRKMQERAKTINPHLAFLPLMYFPEITRRFVDEYGQVIDGVVVAYPQDAEEIENAWAILNDVAVAFHNELSSPWGTPSSPGNFVAVSQRAKVLPQEKHFIRFRQRDDFVGPTSGYHFKQLLIDGDVVWEEDVAGGTKHWQEVVVDVSEFVRGKEAVTVAFRLFDKKGVSNFGVRWQLKDLRADGLKFDADLTEPQKWKVEKRGAFEAGFGEGISQGQGRFHIPFIVMTAAQPYEFRLRHGDPATPKRIAQWLKMCLDMWKGGRCDGVVTYCLDKSPSSQTFPIARKLFTEFCDLKGGAGK